MQFWNEHLKKWNRQYILCLLHQINRKLHVTWASVIECEPNKIVQESLGWGGCLPMSEQSLAHIWLGTLCWWLRDLLKSGSCHLPLRRPQSANPIWNSSCCWHMDWLFLFSLALIPQNSQGWGRGRGPDNHNSDSFAPCWTGLDRHWRALIFVLLGKTSSKNLSTFVYLQLAQRGRENKWKRLKKLILDRVGIKNKKKIL